MNKFTAALLALGLAMCSFADAAHGEVVLASDVDPGFHAISPRNLTVMGGELYFSADDAVHGQELWKSDGTPAGTVMVNDLDITHNPSQSAYRNFQVMNGVLYYSFDDGVHGRELWRSDGTAAGTVLVKDINPADGSFPKSLTVFNNQLFFAAWSAGSGYELLRSDGTEAGTILLKNICPGT